MPGVTLVGPLPADVNRIIGYSVGIPSKAKEMDAAKAFAKFIASGEAALPCLQAEGHGARELSARKRQTTNGE